MIHIVTQENNFVFGDVLDAMFLSRRARYVEGVGWDAVPGDDGWDTDKFDHDSAVYLLCIGDKGKLRSSVRLIPSEAPHVISGKLGYLSEFLPSGSNDVWVIDRLVSDPLDSPARLHLACGIMEFALEQAITSFICFGVLETLRAKMEEFSLAHDSLGVARGIQVARLKADYDALAALRAETGVDGSILSDKPHVVDVDVDNRSPGQRAANSLIDAIRAFVDSEQSEAVDVIKGMHAELSRRIRTR